MIKMVEIEQLKKGFGELTLKDKMSFLTGIDASYNGDICFKCKEQIRTKSSFKIYIKYANKSFNNFNICQNCISKIFNIKIEKLEFFGFLENFKKLEFIRSYDKWDKKITKKFIKLTKYNKIIIDNNAILYEDYKYSKTKKYTMKDLIKKYKLSSQTNEDRI
jgi:hypothetical protein